MGIKRIVDTSFWTDEKVMDIFTPEDRYFMLYLMTNPHTTQLGVYAINIKYMALELGYSQDSVHALIDRFESKYGIIKYSYETKEIAIKNYLKYSIVKGGKPVEDLLIKEINNVKDKSLLKFVYDNINENDNLNETVKTIMQMMNVNDNQNDNDNDVSYHDSYHDSYNDSLVSSSNKIIIPYQAIVDYLNIRTGSHYKASSKKTRDLIKARFNEGFTFEDFQAVIDKKSMEWIKDKNMNKYLRPETLFGTKFESYLNQQVVMTTRDVPIDISDF